jgi:hypothetical protein
MKRILTVLGLLTALGGGAASAQTHVSVSLSFGAPFVAYHPYQRSYGYHRYRVYDPRPTIVVARPYRPARLIVVRHKPRRHHRHW